MIEVLLYCIVSIGAITLDTPVCLNQYDMTQFVRYNDQELSMFTIKHKVNGV